jgi:hypothetical protein
MARTRTLAELIADVKAEGGYNRSLVFTDAVLTRWINQAICEVYEHLANKFEGHYVSEASLSTVAGQVYVNLPSDFWKLLRLDVLQSSGVYYPMRRIALSAEDGYANGAFFDSRYGIYEYYGYYIRASRIQLVPTPTKVDTIRCVYIPYSTDLSASSSTFDGINGYEDLVVQIVLRKCYQREQKDTRPAQMEIDRIFKRIDREASERNAAEPVPACDFGGR